MDPEIIILSEVSKKEKDKYMWNLKMWYKWIYKTERDTNELL